MKWNKYHAKKVDGFHSKLEASVYRTLQLRERAGEIASLVKQVRINLTEAKIVAIMDFSYLDVDTRQIVFVEAKGKELERWKIIKQLWEIYGRYRLEIWKGDYRKGEIRPYCAEVIEPNRGAKCHRKRGFFTISKADIR